LVIYFLPSFLPSFDHLYQQLWLFPSPSFLPFPSSLPTFDHV
jgi:hypothetical protein